MPDVLGDFPSVDDGIFCDDVEVLHGVFDCGYDVVEFGPASASGVDRLADWEGLLELFNEANCSDNTADSLLDVLVFDGLLNLINA